MNDKMFNKLQYELDMAKARVIELGEQIKECSARLEEARLRKNAVEDLMDEYREGVPKENVVQLRRRAVRQT